MERAKVMEVPRSGVGAWSGPPALPTASQRALWQYGCCGRRKGDDLGSQWTQWDSGIRLLAVSCGKGQPNARSPEMWEGQTPIRRESLVLLCSPFPTGVPGQPPGFVRNAAPCVLFAT